MSGCFRLGWNLEELGVSGAGLDSVASRCPQLCRAAVNLSSKFSPALTLVSPYIFLIGLFKRLRVGGANLSLILPLLTAAPTAGMKVLGHACIQCLWGHGCGPLKVWNSFLCIEIIMSFK